MTKSQEIINLEDFVSDVDNLMAKSKEKKSGRKGRKPANKPVDKNENEERQNIALTRTRVKEQEQKFQETVYSMYGNNFLTKITRDYIQNFENTNNRVKSAKERMAIIQAEMAQYRRNGNYDAVKACEEELARVRKDFDVTQKALKEKTNDKSASAFIEINVNELDDKLTDLTSKLDVVKTPEAKYELECKINDIKEEISEAEIHNANLIKFNKLKKQISKLKEERREADFKPLARLLTDINKELEIVKKHSDFGDFESLENMLEKENIEALTKNALIAEFSENEISDANADIDDEIENSNYINTIAEINGMGLKDKIKELAKLIVSILPKSSKVTTSHIEFLIKEGKHKRIKDLVNQFKNNERVEAIDKELEKLTNQRDETLSQLKNRGNIADFVFDFLKYDEADENSQMVAKSVLIASSVKWMVQIVRNILYKYGSTDKQLYDDCVSEGAVIICERANHWFKARSEGKEQEWFAYIATAISQGVRKFIATWRSSGTISGSNTRQIIFDQNKRFNHLLKTYIDEHPSAVNKNGDVEQWAKDYIQTIIDKEEMQTLSIEQASAFEAGIARGGDGNEEKVNYDNFAALDTRQEISLPETKLACEELVRNMGKFFALLDTDKNGKPIHKHIFTGIDILIIKFTLGLEYDKSTGKRYSQQMCIKLCNEYIKKHPQEKIKTPTGLFPENSTSSYSTRKTVLFGNETAMKKYNEQRSLYRQGLIDVKPEKPTNIRGKLQEVLDANPDLKNAFEELCVLLDNFFIGELSSTEKQLVDVIDEEREKSLNNHQQEILNKSINLDLALGDDELNSLEDFSSAYSQMIDFTGLKL